MTTQLTDNTAAYLADLYNSLTGKSVKSTSYSKAKFAEMIEEIREEELTEVDPDDEEVEEDDDGETFTIAELARELGINPKIARTRYRRHYNDKVQTYYEFDSSERAAVTAIISPKK